MTVTKSDRDAVSGNASGKPKSTRGVVMEKNTNLLYITEQIELGRPE